MRKATLAMTVLLLAIALVNDPQLVFLDEPTTGLDPIMAGVINDLIREIVTEMGATAVTITHDMSSVRAIADEQHAGCWELWKKALQRQQQLSHPFGAATLDHVVERLHPLLFLEQVGHLAQSVLGLRHCHAVTGNDNHRLRCLEDVVSVLDGCGLHLTLDLSPHFLGG